MVCNYCFGYEEINNYKKENDSKASHYYQCPDCQSLMVNLNDK